MSEKAFNQVTNPPEKRLGDFELIVIPPHVEVRQDNRGVFETTPSPEILG